MDEFPVNVVPWWSGLALVASMATSVYLPPDHGLPWFMFAASAVGAFLNAAVSASLSTKVADSRKDRLRRRVINDDR